MRLRFSVNLSKGAIFDLLPADRVVQQSVNQWSVCIVHVKSFIQGS